MVDCRNMCNYLKYLNTTQSTHTCTLESMRQLPVPTAGLCNISFAHVLRTKQTTQQHLTLLFAVKWFLHRHSLLRNIYRRICKEIKAKYRLITVLVKIIQANYSKPRTAKKRREADS